jgi:prepilin-type processing-associated H-X9-DG protein
MSNGEKQRFGRWIEVSIVLAICAIVLGLILPIKHPVIYTGEGQKAVHITCVNNLKQIGLCFRILSDDRGNYPFNVSTNAGGTLELCAMGKDGFDSNAALHLKALSNELVTPIVLICPQDSSKKVAVDFQSLGPANVSYRLRTGTNISEANPRTVLLVCPIDGNILYCDGSVAEPRSRMAAKAPQ